MATEFKILDHSTVPALDPARKGKEDEVVTYAVNGTRGYMVRVPKETATEGAIVAAIKADIERRGKLVGRTFSV